MSVREGTLGALQAMQNNSKALVIRPASEQHVSLLPFPETVTREMMTLVGFRYANSETDLLNIVGNLHLGGEYLAVVIEFSKASELKFIAEVMSLACSCTQVQHLIFSIKDVELIRAAKKVLAWRGAMHCDVPKYDF